MAKEEDTVALLCAAARKWAKWDARYQAFMTDDLQEMGEHDRLDAKRHKWMTRTLSYGHHLLAEPVPGGDVWTLEEMEAMRAKKAPPLEFNRIVEDGPFSIRQADINRLDTLVQQLCARVAVLEDGGRTVQG